MSHYCATCCRPISHRDALDHGRDDLGRNLHICTTCALTNRPRFDREAEVEEWYERQRLENDDR